MKIFGTKIKFLNNYDTVFSAFIKKTRLNGLLGGVLIGLIFALAITSIVFAVTSHNGGHNRNVRLNTHVKGAQTSAKSTSVNSKSATNNASVNSGTTGINKPTIENTKTNLSSASTSSGSSQQSNSSPKPAPKITGIEVDTPTPGANETIYIPYCDFGVIIGQQQTCNHYSPITFSLVALYSDGSTQHISWHDASVSSPDPSGGKPYIPTLLDVNESNNTLVLGTGPQYFLGTNTHDAVIPIYISYQQWTYTKYIHIYVSGLWG